MADTAPPQLLTMRKNTGTLEAPGAADNPVILGFAAFIGDRFPRMKKYSASYTHDSIAWCGLAVAYAMAANGIEPPYDPTDDLKSYFWAMSWMDWGTPADKPKLGDVLVFAFGGDDHHVTMYDGDADATHYLCIGGNQSDSIKVSSYLKSQCIGIRRAPEPTAIAAPMSFPALVSTTPATSIFIEALEHVLVYEGGNDDDPRDPGGRTSRGILQREWNVWRTTHPGLPSDVWQAPDDQVAAIYRQNYWDALCCDQLPAGVNFAVFDYGVNSGISRSAKALQSFVETEVDGEVGPDTIAASCKADPATLIGQICDQRIAFLKGLPDLGDFRQRMDNPGDRREEDGVGHGRRRTDHASRACLSPSTEAASRGRPYDHPYPTTPRPIGEPDVQHRCAGQGGGTNHGHDGHTPYVTAGVRPQKY